MITARFKLYSETKGALRYHEVDDHNQPVDLALCKIGTIYLRKNALGGKQPKSIEVAITLQGEESA